MKYFLFNHVGSSNHGCEAIVRGTVNIISNCDPNAEFLLSSYSPETDAGIEGIKVVKFSKRELTRFEHIIAALEYKFRHSDEYALTKMYSDVIRQAENCDICLSIGGDTYCYGDNHELQVVTKKLKENKKVVLWGASIGEEDLSQSKLENLKLFDAVFARESLTYEILKKCNANDRIELFPDSAFCLDREEQELPEGFCKNNTLGLNVSPLIVKGNSAITESIKKFIEYIINNTTLKILLVPHVIQDGNNDYEYMKPFFEEFKGTERIEILPDNLDARQYKGYIAKTRFFIGARTHTTIAAYSSGVPTVVLGYSVKSKGIAKDLFGEEKYVIDSKEIKDEKIIVEQFRLLLENENEIRETLMKTIPLKLRDAMEMGRKLTEI